MGRGLGIMVMIGVLASASPGMLRAQISPGPLARVHSDLEGARQCLKCHPVGRKDAMDGACLQCHREIDWLRTARRGLHGREVTGRCSACHPDHAGTDFALIAWTADSLSRFDHRRTGYVLDGAHAEVKCDDCHRQANRVGRAARLAPAGTKPVWWIGLEASCASCHEDVHQGRLKAACSDCHTTAAWAPAPRFDHSRTDYPLTGKHAEVPCRQCHRPIGESPRPGRSEVDPAFAPVEFAQCAACHQDPHQGRLGPACSSCHVTSSFTDRKGGGFEHGRTRYPLEGRHATVSCGACHGTGSRRRNPAFATCASCHRDAHDSSATVPAQVRDCATCHTLEGFKPSSFTAVQHRGGRCEGCHAASHGRELAGLAGLTSCGSCHDVDGWAASTYPAERHRTAGLPLEGRHAAVRCGACHAMSRADLPPLTGTDSLGPAGVRFKLGTASCTSCHADPHQGRYLERCATCHDARSFKPSTMGPATHAEFGDPLLGAHRAVPCAACHEGLEGRTGGAFLVRGALQPASLTFSTSRTTCEACHRTPHGDQFASREGGRCDRCHGEDRFVPAERFDHDRDAAFSLKGAHRTVACVKCHAPERVTGGATMVRYRPAPLACEECHTARPGRRTEGRW